MIRTSHAPENCSDQGPESLEELDIMIYRGLVIPDGPLYPSYQATRDTPDNVYEVFLKDLIDSIES